MAQHDSSWDSLADGVDGWCWMLQHVSTLTLWHDVKWCFTGGFQEIGKKIRTVEQNGAFNAKAPGLRRPCCQIWSSKVVLDFLDILDILDCGYVLHPLVQFFGIPSAGSASWQAVLTPKAATWWHSSLSRSQCVNPSLNTRKCREKKQKKRTFQFQDLFCDAGHIAFEYFIWYM